MYKKIVIVGNTGSGKTTLANKLGLLFNIPVYHLDKIFWIQKGGIKQDVFIAQQQEMMKGESWIIEGDFTRSKSFDLRLQHADTIIFFSLPRRIIYWRYLKRFLKYFYRIRPDVGGNNKATIDWHSIKFIWNYPKIEICSRIMGQAEKKEIIILRSIADEKKFYRKMKKMNQ